MASDSASHARGVISGICQSSVLGFTRFAVFYAYNSLFVAGFQKTKLFCTFFIDGLNFMPFGEPTIDCLALETDFDVPCEYLSQ